MNDHYDEIKKTADEIREVALIHIDDDTFMKSFLRSI